MSEINTGGSAFPMSGFDTRHGQPIQAVYQHGMTLRDYFAAKAMQGICGSGPGTHMTNNRIAAEAYNLADAMLAARSAT